ncbi:MAG TPA: hypothetical protein VNU01_08205, partial [Egibacteraceae bacterium]|nr:hypothetical protein [Egibacteraceae bacterium]
VETIKHLEIQYEELKKLEGEASVDGLLGIASADRVRQAVRAKRAALRHDARMRAQATSLDIAKELEKARERLGDLTADLANASTGKALMDAAREALSDDLSDLTLDKNAHDEVLDAARDASLDADGDVTEREVDVEQATKALEAITAGAGNAGETVEAIAARIQDKEVDVLGTVATVRNLAADLAALVPIYQGLTETLQPWPMFKIHAISYELDTRVGYHGTQAKVRCGLEGVELLGEMLPLRTCDDLRGAKPMIEQELADFLALFTLERPEVELTVPSGIVDDQGLVNGQRKVRTALTPLSLSISPFQLRTLTDPLMDTINARIDTLQEQVSYDEIRDLARLGEPPQKLTDWVLDWPRDREWEAPSDRDQIEMASVRPARVQAAGEPRYGAASADPGNTEQDLDRELDGFQEDAGQTAGNEVGGQGTSGVDASVGGMETDVMWAGCVGCVDPPCQPGEPDCPDPGPCVQGSPDCPPPCVPGNPDCPVNCRAGDLDCPDKCKPGAACTGDKLKGGKGTAGDAEGADGGAGGPGNGGGGDGTGNGVDGYPLGDVVGDANLPHTGGRPATLLLGLVLLLAAGLMRRRPAAAEPTRR